MPTDGNAAFLWAPVAGSTTEPADAASAAAGGLSLVGGGAAVLAALLGALGGISCSMTCGYAFVTLLCAFGPTDNAMLRTGRC